MFSYRADGIKGRQTGVGDTMTDKEVGELWRDSNDNISGWPGLCRELIRKLVEERTKKNRVICRFADHNNYCPHDDSCHEREAVRDFGIPPETWK